MSNLDDESMEYERACDEFIYSVVRPCIEELVEEDDLDYFMKLVDELISEASVANEHFAFEGATAEYIYESLIEVGECEKKIKMYDEYYGYLSSCGYDPRQHFIFVDLPDAYAYGKLTDDSKLVKMALESFGPRCPIPDLLEVYENCCKYRIDTKEIVDKIKKQVLESDLIGEFCSVMLEYQEPHLAYHLARHMFEQGPEEEPFIQWIEGVQSFAEIGNNKEVLHGVEALLKDSGKLDSQITDLQYLIHVVKRLGKDVEKFYGINIPHLDNIRFKKPTGSYGSISRYGMMKRAVGE